MRTLTAEGTFKTVQGDDPRALHVFLSADCTFCRQIEPELGKLENVTVYRHLLPGHTHAGRLAAIDVWCSPTPAVAWKNVAAGLPTGSETRSEKCDGNVLERNLDLAKRLGLTSTPTVTSRLECFQQGSSRAGSRKHRHTDRRSVAFTDQVHPDERIDPPAMHQVDVDRPDKGKHFFRPHAFRDRS